VRESSRRPDPGEADAYYGGYLTRVPDGDIFATLERQRDEFLDLVGGLPPAKVDHRYAEGKWSVAELVRHVVDTEWVVAGRALFFARGNPGPLAGMDQDEFLREVSPSQLQIQPMIEEFRHLRSAVLVGFRGLAAEDWERRGVASGCMFTVRALIWILAGHLAHHQDVLKQRYLS